MNVERVDVVVLGLGPAGASAAAAAALRGCRVAGVDRRRRPGIPVQCAEFVPAMIGIDVGRLEASIEQRISSMMTFVEDDAPDVEPRFPGQMLDRALFDAGLVDEAKAAGAVCRFGVNVRRIDGSGQVHLSDGRVVAAPVIVGADGPRSLAGRAIGSVNTMLVETRQITVALSDAHEATDIFLSSATPGGYAWLFPKGKLANVGAGVDPAYKARLKDILGDLHRSLVARGRVGAEVLARTGGLIPVGGMLKPHGRRGDARVLLAGDAAGLSNPVTGAGIASAVHSGRLAGEAAALAAGGAATAAEDYDDELTCVCGAALARAASRRQERAAAANAGGTPSKAALRRAWVAYPEYWAEYRAH
jgi:geranylgeranyl reductase family protein